ERACAAWRIQQGPRALPPHGISWTAGGDPGHGDATAGNRSTRRGQRGRGAVRNLPTKLAVRPQRRQDPVDEFTHRGVVYLWCDRFPRQRRSPGLGRKRAVGGCEKAASTSAATAPDCRCTANNLRI